MEVTKKINVKETKQTNIQFAKKVNIKIRNFDF